MKRNIEGNKKEDAAPLAVSPPGGDNLKTGLAIGTITLAVTALVLYLVNYFIYNNYHPDVETLLDKAVALSICPREWFAPEPVERMQFVVSVLLAPFLILGFFSLVNRKRDFFYNRPLACTYINMAGLAVFVLYVFEILSANLVHVKDQTNAWIFNNNLISVLPALIAILLYCGIAFLLYLYCKNKETVTWKVVTRVVVCGVVAFVIMDIVLYDVFHMANVGLSTKNETNPAFYALTQVYAGKSLLVDINCIYGLYPWVLLPVFKLIGMSTFKIGMVFAVLNGASFLFIYLGLKKVIKQEWLSFLVFLCVVFWQFWQTRIPFDEVEGSRFYYQYNPIRLLFPAMAFCLIAFYQEAGEKRRRLLLPVLTLMASLSVLWNLDTGVVVYAAVFAALLFACFETTTLKAALKKCLFYSCWMVGSLLLVLAMFFLTTKMRSGQWPDLHHLSDFQGIFYITGFFMLPMTALHFWNLPVLVYLAAGIYCVARLASSGTRESMVMAFLFVLGIGLFAYFQGRSYDTNICMVIYPAIIIAGVFCGWLLVRFAAAKPRFHEGMVFFMIPFIFIADGACSMVYYMPQAHSFAWHNAFPARSEKDSNLHRQLDFIRQNIPEGDTVLIIAKNYEGYYYASGHYYNPLNLPGSSEMLFKSEMDSLLRYIRTTKYPIIYDARLQWFYSDTILNAMSKYTTIEKTCKNDPQIILARSGQQASKQLTTDRNTMYYNSLGGYGKCKMETVPIDYPDSFTLEIIATLDSGNLSKNNVMLGTATRNTPYTGIILKQNGDDLTRYSFAYGNGKEWSTGVFFRLSCTGANHLVIKVQKNITTVFNNNILCGTSVAKDGVKNGDGVLVINPAYAGTVNELKISSP